MQRVNSKFNIKEAHGVILVHFSMINIEYVGKVCCSCLKVCSSYSLDRSCKLDWSDSPVSSDEPQFLFHLKQLIEFIKTTDSVTIESLCCHLAKYKITIFIMVNSYQENKVMLNSNSLVFKLFVFYCHYYFVHICFPCFCLEYGTFPLWKKMNFQFHSDGE